MTAPAPGGGPAASSPVDAATGWRDSTRRIATLAWPVFVGQVSVLAFATIDTVLVGRAGATDLAALAVGSAAYITVFIGLMGAVLALAPIVGQLHGAGRDAEAGRQAHQALWLALAFSVVGCTLLAFPAPFVALARAGPEVEAKVRHYLLALAFALPATLLFTVYRGFNTAVSRPKAVMAIQVGALLLKLPLSTALVFGFAPLGLPALGVAGCGVATALAMWTQVAVALAVVRRDPFYARFELVGHGWQRPQWASLRQQLALGVPSGAAILVEVTGFAMMAIFISRLGGTTPVAGHQIAANLVSLLFMMPLALANAGGTLVAQAIGAGRAEAARRIGWHAMGLGCAVAAVMGSAVYLARPWIVGLYTRDAAVAAVALSLVAWVALFHVADAAQTIAAFVLRAHKIATLPMLVYVLALWGVGLAGGWALAFDVAGVAPPSLHGAPGFWFASTSGLVVAALLLAALKAWLLRPDRSR